MKFDLILDNDVMKSDVGILDFVLCSGFRWRTRRVCNVSNFKPGQRWQVFADGKGDEYRGTLTVASVNAEKNDVTFKEFLPRPIQFPVHFVFPGDLLVLIPEGLSS